MQKITPFLWFDTQAEEAVNFYISTFNNAKINGVTHYAEGGMMPAGLVMTMSFQIEGQNFVALNGGPMFQFSQAVSFVIDCKDQAEVDHLWSTLSQGGEEQMCGWVKDKYGMTWQVVPTVLMDYLQDADPAKAGRVAQAMMQMKKIDIQVLHDAYNQV